MRRGRWIDGVLGTLVVVTCAVTSSPARAQTGEPPPGTFTLDRMDESSRFGVQASFEKIDNVDLSDGFVMRYELYGQYVLPSHLIGFYGQLPFAHLFDFDGAGTDYNALANLDVGAFVLPTHRSDLILRLGLALPTASENSARALTNVVASYERITDLLLAIPNYTTLRLSASTLQETGIAFFRADLGLDVVVDRPSNRTGASAFLRANVAAGVRLAALDLTAELVNLGALNGPDAGGITNRFVHTLAFGLSTRGTDQFHVGTVFPLDKSVRGDIWILSVGYQHAMN